MNLKRFFSVLLVLFLFGLFLFTSFAETIDIEVPVYCKGVSCDAVLCDKGGSALDRKTLSVEDVTYFYIACTKPGDYYYTLKLDIPDDPNYKYDMRVYDLHVFSYFDGDGNLAGVVAPDFDGSIAIGGKPAYIIFDNVPIDQPTPVPTEEPTPVPTEEPTPAPTVEPTSAPTVEPTPVPTEEPTSVPTVEPTSAPTVLPTAIATVAPTKQPVVTAKPTSVPTVSPDGKATDVDTGDIGTGVFVIFGVVACLSLLLMFVFVFKRKRD